MVVGEGDSARSGKWIFINGAVAAWQIFDIATAVEARPQALLILQYFAIVGALCGLVGATIQFTRGK